jgi:DNA-binding CsgD family transcriptional regulator
VSAFWQSEHFIRAHFFGGGVDMNGKPARLTKQQRQERIVAELHISPTIRASEIAAKLGVHTETVRRDLKHLDRNGLLSRTYGGAAVAPLAFEPSLTDRDRILVPERRSIGECAAGLIEPGDVLMIDAGSTTIHFARQLAARGQNPPLSPTAMGSPPCWRAARRFAFSSARESITADKEASAAPTR